MTARATNARQPTRATATETGYLQEAGYRVRRFTWRKITDEPDEVVRSLKALLG